MQARVAAGAAVVAALGLAIAVPGASAKTSKTDKSQSKAIKKQSKTLKSHSKTLKSHSKTLKSQSKAVKVLGGSVAGAGTAINALKVIADRGDANAKTVLDQAPAIIKGLTDLKTGLEAAGAGLTQLKTLAGSQEYGIAQVTGEAGTFLETPDIPDTVQQAQVSRQFTATTAGTNQIAVQYGVRSNESDGDGTVAAADCRVSVANGTGVTESTTGGSFGNGFLSVLTKSTLTSSAAANALFPFQLKTAPPDADVTQTFTTTAVPVTQGDRYTVTIACVDTTPSATDPSA